MVLGVGIELATGKGNEGDRGGLGGKQKNLVVMLSLFFLST